MTPSPDALVQIPERGHLTSLITILPVWAVSMPNHLIGHWPAQGLAKDRTTLDQSDGSGRRGLTATQCGCHSPLVGKKLPLYGSDWDVTHQEELAQYNR